MKIVVQRSKKSFVKVNNELISSIDSGMVLLVCLEKDDSEKSIITAAEKILNLRIFPDKENRMNKNILQFEGQILAVSQFTLSWPGKKGNRPSFDNSMKPTQANKFFNFFCQLLEESVIVKRGVFGENMEVTITNDGPVTFFLDF